MSDNEFEIWQSAYLEMMNDKLKINDKKKQIDKKLSLYDLYNERSIMWTDFLEEDCLIIATENDHGSYNKKNILHSNTEINNEIIKDNHRKNEIEKDIENLNPIIKQYEEKSNISQNTFDSVEKNIDENNLMIKRLENDEDLAIQLQEQEIIEDYKIIKKELESDNEPKRKSGCRRKRQRREKNTLKVPRYERKFI